MTSKIEIRRQKALRLLEDLDDGEADLVITDPPYNVNLDYDEYDDEMKHQDYWSWMYEFVNEAERVTGENGAVAIVTPKNQRREWTGLLDQLNHQEINGSPVIWCRPNLVGNVPFGGGFHPASYFVYVVAGTDFETDTSPTESESGSSVTSHDYVVAAAPQSNWKEGRHHPAQQPVKMYEKFVIKCCPRDGIVVDPFVGSGSTAVAAKKWNRRFTGCDISEDYVEKARKRVDETETVDITGQTEIGEWG